MNYLEFLYQALANEHGLVLRSSDPKIALQRLYAARKESGDPALWQLSFHPSPTVPDEIWIRKNAKGTEGITTSKDDQPAAG